MSENTDYHLDHIDTALRQLNTTFKDIRYALADLAASNIRVADNLEGVEEEVGGVKDQISDHTKDIVAAIEAAACGETGIGREISRVGEAIQELVELQTEKA